MRTAVRRITPLAAAAALLVAGCASSDNCGLGWHIVPEQRTTSGSMADYAKYPSVQGLSAVADAVVEARAGDVIGTEVDNADPSTGTGPRAAVQKFHVLASAKGSAAGSDISVVLEGSSSTGTDPALNVVVKPGATVALFLKWREPCGPGISLAASCYIPVSGGYGIFDKSQDSYLSRGDGFDRLADADEPAKAAGRVQAPWNLLAATATMPAGSN